LGRDAIWYAAYDANEKASEKKHNRPPVPLRTWESDPSRDAKRQGVQERVLAPRV